MTPHDRRPCLLTIRLAQDLKIRNMAERTIDAYTYHAGKFADFINKPLDCVTPEDVRSFQLHLIEERKLAYSSFNQAVCALRFLYTHTIRVPWPVTMVPFGKRPKTLPVVLGRQEVDDLLSTTMVYLHCRREHLISAPSPLDWLPVKQLPTYQPPAENVQPLPDKQSPPEQQQPESRQPPS